MCSFLFTVYFILFLLLWCVSLLSTSWQWVIINSSQSRSNCLGGSILPTCCLYPHTPLSIEYYVDADSVSSICSCCTLLIIDTLASTFNIFWWHLQIASSFSFVLSLSAILFRPHRLFDSRSWWNAMVDLVSSCGVVDHGQTTVPAVTMTSQHGLSISRWRPTASLALSSGWMVSMMQSTCLVRPVLQLVANPVFFIFMFNRNFLKFLYLVSKLNTVQ